MQDFSTRLTIITDACSASLTWLVGDLSQDSSTSYSGIDFGNGVEMSSADVMDSHFERFVKNQPAIDHPAEQSSDKLSRRPMDGSLPERTSFDSPQDNSPPLTDEANPASDPRASDPHSKAESSSLNHAIAHLAPDLLPLVQVADQLSTAQMPINASDEFRTLLNNALAAEQKQQINKQAIGIQPLDQDENALDMVSPKPGTIFFGLMFIVGAILGIWYMLNRRAKA